MPIKLEINIFFNQKMSLICVKIVLYGTGTGNDFYVIYSVDPCKIVFQKIIYNKYLFMGDSPEPVHFYRLRLQQKFRLRPVPVPQCSSEYQCSSLFSTEL